MLAGRLRLAFGVRQFRLPALDRRLDLVAIHPKRLVLSRPFLRFSLQSISLRRQFDVFLSQRPHLTLRSVDLALHRFELVTFAFEIALDGSYLFRRHFKPLYLLGKVVALRTKRCYVVLNSISFRSRRYRVALGLDGLATSLVAPPDQHLAFVLQHIRPRFRFRCRVSRRVGLALKPRGPQTDSSPLAFQRFPVSGEFGVLGPDLLATFAIPRKRSLDGYQFVFRLPELLLRPTFLRNHPVARAIEPGDFLLQGIRLTLPI